TIRQTQEKLRKYGSYRVWIPVATYVKCQQTLALYGLDQKNHDVQ
ncbi:hypothetical protein SAMN05428952_1009110, partial [Nitrosomonas sp. Nm132]